MIKRLCLVLACSALTAAVIGAQVQKSESRRMAQTAAPLPSPPPEPSSPAVAVPNAPATAKASTPPAIPSDVPSEELVSKPAESRSKGRVVAQPSPVETPFVAPAIADVKGTGRRGQLLSSEIGGRDLLFLTTALENGHLQLYLGELAKAKAGTEQVKAVGEVLASNQAEENEKLARLAAAKGVTLPGGEAAAKKTLAAKFGKLTGPKLDKALLEEIIQVNERAVSAYEAAAQTKDEEIKAFVDENLPLAKEKLTLTNKMTGNKPRNDQRPGFRARIDALDNE